MAATMTCFHIAGASLELSAFLKTEANGPLTTSLQSLLHYSEIISSGPADLNVYSQSIYYSTPGSLTFFSAHCLAMSAHQH